MDTTKRRPSPVTLREILSPRHSTTSPASTTSAGSRSASHSARSRAPAGQRALDMGDALLVVVEARRVELERRRRVDAGAGACGPALLLYAGGAGLARRPLDRVEEIARGLRPAAGGAEFCPPLFWGQLLAFPAALSGSGSSGKSRGATPVVGDSARDAGGHVADA